MELKFGKLLIGFILLLFFAGEYSSALAAPSISVISDSGQTGRFEKFEVNINVSTIAQNPFYPYDEMVTPVAGLTPKLGVSVDGVFLPPSAKGDWSKAYKQPGFYFVEYSENGSLYLPTGNTYWKVRFAPDEVGTWQYKVTVRDSGGAAETSPRSFTVITSANHGFVRVSKNDPRYFEFSDGTYFPGLAINDSLDKNNPTNTTILSRYGTNGIQVMRFWLTYWTIFGSSWTPWESIKGTYDGYLPRTGLITNRAESTSSEPQAMLTLVYSESGGQQNQGSWFDACHLTVSSGGQINFATKSNTTYRIRIRYKATGISGPRVQDLTNFPNKDNYGLVLKKQNPNNGNWHGFQNPGGECWNYSADNKTTGVRLTPYGKNSSDWTYLESDWLSTGASTPILYLALENSLSNPTGYVYIDSVEIREKKADGTLGPNIVYQSSFSFLEHVNDRNAYAFDKAIELAKQYGVYLKAVILEKNEHVENEIGFNGQKAEFNNNNFYGNWRNITAVRWYQQAWWRYLQARWGYSTAIHSWELVNEGDPYNSQHWTLADELAKYMKCGAFGINAGTADGAKCNYYHPNSHMASTSFWHSIVKTDFWANSKYPNVDYADVHDYINKPDEPNNFCDTALATYNIGKAYYDQAPVGSNKPVIRGETALIADSGTDNAAQVDSKGVFLHNFIWGGINHYAATEAWWHLYQLGSNNWGKYKQYFDFIKDVPLNNGKYQDAAAQASDSNVRVWGQKDSKGQAATHAHLWIQNSKHVWSAFVSSSGCNRSWDGSRLNGTVTISGFAPNKTFPIEWWNFDTNVNLTKTAGTVLSNSSGQIILDLATLPSTVVDTGVKIGDYSVTLPSATPTVPPLGDLNNDGKVDIVDLKILLSRYLSSDSVADLNRDNSVNLLDAGVLIANMGR